MNCFPRPNIVISRCIEFDHCRYDGSMIASDFVAALKPHAHFIPVCAEMEIGLGVPRSSIRVVSVKGELRLIQSATVLDVTDKMVSFSRSFLCSLSGIDEEYLKEQTFFEPFPENLIELCRDTQCEWAGADLFEGRKAGRAD